MQKVREAMKSSESKKMDGKVQVDEFTIGGKRGRKYTKKSLGYKVYILGYQNLT